MRKNRNNTLGQRTKEKYILIICEGSRTEPNYFKSFAINKRSIELMIEGQGYNTLTLVQDAISKKANGFSANIPFDEVFAVFDKDSFPDQYFNSAIQLAKSNDIEPIWSNQSFELWYVLHFKYDEGNRERTDYITYLNSKIPNGYRKDMPDIRSLLKQKEANAIRNAKRLAEQSESDFRNQFSSRNPCTMVFKLVEKLIELEQ